ncbi:MAG: hypothetical protein COT73_01715 [Bdellovibrio sp. CG10_big_fil_rev_8_21_14_0_10_47_8]|nr:MAG: hypothetical protein COT73_01715 [Bdellovibrio sp. CG10_big_fil_rev_8_21_14_0_10_47_8]
MSLKIRNLKSSLFRILLLVPAGYWVYLIGSGSIGVDPAKTLNHKTGEIALYYILFNLLLGILISFSFRFPVFLRFLLMQRRFVGVLSFVFLIFHIFLYLTMEGFETKAWTQLVTKTYLIFGLGAWIILFALAVTSNDFSVRRLGVKRWKRFHRLVYIASALFTAHILSIEKTDLIKYGSLLLSLWGLQIIRVLWVWRKKRITRKVINAKQV